MNNDLSHERSQGAMRQEDLITVLFRFTCIWMHRLEQRAVLANDGMRLRKSPLIEL
jgi:hypothetical protein